MQTDHDTELTISPPDPQKPPMKANVFFTARAAASQLNPMFPYHQRGDIVACTASFRSKPGSPPIGYFHHSNSVDEVALVFGSTGDMRTGDVHVGAKKHGVGGWGERGDFFTTMVITQRQLEQGPQPEAMAFVCEKCNEVVSSLDFEGVSMPDDRSVFPPLPTIEGSYLSAAAFNKSEESRTCKACGHLNQAFPMHIWGWDRYMFNTGVVNEAWVANQEAGKS